MAKQWIKVRGVVKLVEDETLETWEKIKGNLCQNEKGQFSACDKVGVGSSPTAEKVIAQATSTKAGGEPTPKKPPVAPTKKPVPAPTPAPEEKKVAGNDPAFLKNWASDKEKALKEWSTKETKPKPVKGKLGTDSIKNVFQNARSRLSQYATNLPGDDVDSMHSFLQDQHDLVHQAVKDGDLKDVDAGELDTMMSEAVDNLVYQTQESYKRQLGDHGIRHIKGNIDTSNKVLDALENQDSKRKTSAKDRLMMSMTHVNHDLGYTAEPARMGFEHTGEHKEYSDGLFKDQMGDRYKKVFGEDGAKKMSEMISTHDSSDIDWDKDPLASSVRVGDNLSLYSGEKLPALFRLVDGSMDVLEKIHKGSTGKPPDEDAVTKGREELIEKLKKSNLPGTMKQALANAAKEVSRFTPRFTLGMMGGHLDKMDFDGERLSVKVKKDEYDERLQKMFDMGQSQFKKLAESYGIKDLSADRFDFKKDKKTVLEVNIA